MDFLSGAALTNLLVSSWVDTSNCPKEEGVDIDSSFGFNDGDLLFLVSDFRISIGHELYKTSIFSLKPYIYPIIKFILVEGVGAPCTFIYE